MSPSCKKYLNFLLLTVAVCDVAFAQRLLPHDKPSRGGKDKDSDNGGNKNNYNYGNPDNSNNNNYNDGDDGDKQAAPNLWVASSSNNCSCTRELTALKRDLRDEISQRLEMKLELDKYVAELQELKTMMSSNNNSNKFGLAPNSLERPSVAFSAKLSYNRELKPLDTVIFDTVLTNNGAAYDPDTGKFTATVAGTYIFHATILSGYNTKVETAIIVNDKEVSRIYSGAHDAHGSGSNAAVVDLLSGDAVWVRLLYQGGNHVHGYYSTFSGSLLRAADP